MVDIKTLHKVNLTSAEMTSLWTNYQNDSMEICVLSHFLKNAEDMEIRAVLQYAIDLSQKHVQKVTQIFKEEQIVIPQGFSLQEDVNGNAPRLYSDIFYLMYIHNQSKFGIHGYSVALSTAARSDIRKWYSELITSSTELFNRSSEVLLSKGLFLRAPAIPKPQTIDFVQKQPFLTGWLGDRRPLNGIEITHLYFNWIRNLFGGALLLGFSQIATSPSVREYFKRGWLIGKKHAEIFQSLLTEEDLPASNTWDVIPTDSTVAPFSDKLMMFHGAAMTSAGVGYYGASLGVSQRRDLGSHYMRLLAETLQYGEDGANMMIENGWMEKPPSALDREALQG